MKACNIYWDIEYEWQLEELPEEIEIDPNDLGIKEGDDSRVIIESVSDYISNVTGFCHCGFTLID